MREIRTLCDALLNTPVQEDQCTNALLWLLRILPRDFFRSFCQEAGLPSDDISNEFAFSSQLFLTDSHPDGVIQVSPTKYLIIETKRFANRFDKDQFKNHVHGCEAEYGSGNCLYLFISGDSEPPREFQHWRLEYSNCFGFISWRKIRELLGVQLGLVNTPYQILLNEFLAIARHHKLGTFIYMNEKQTNDFLGAYPLVRQYQDAAQETFRSILDNLTDRIISNSAERIERNTDDWENALPCPYRGLTISGWHIPGVSAFVFISALRREIGLIANGYQNAVEKSVLLPLWQSQFQKKYESNSQLRAFTWFADEDSGCAYFKGYPETSGKLFNPDKLLIFANHFYFGYAYPLNAETLDEKLYAQIAGDAKELVDSFTVV